jgi:hypothetical protein
MPSDGILIENLSKGKVFLRQASSGMSTAEKINVVGNLVGPIKA